MLGKLKKLDLHAYGLLLWAVPALVLAWVLYPHPTPTHDGQKVTDVKFWVATGWAMDMVKPAVEEFERRHPEYNVITSISSMRDTDPDPTRFLLSVAGEDPPDLNFFDTFAIAEWASRGAFTDLRDLIARDRDLPDGVKPERFLQSGWAEATYQGKVYAVPNNVDTRAMFYNSDALIRAGFVYKATDPEVRAGQAEAGRPRPPQTWEEMCDKLLHAKGVADAQGRVSLKGFFRRQAVNESLPQDAQVDLAALRVRAGDVVALIRGANVFRARILRVEAPGRLVLDLQTEQRPGLKALPSVVCGDVEVKVFSQDSFVCRLTRFDPQTGQMTSAGFVPFFGNSWLYMYGWLNDAHFMSADGTRCTLDSPEIVEALQWLTDVHDSMGGVEAVNMFQSGAISGALDPFLSGKIALRIDTAGVMMVILAYAPNLDFGVAPGPIPQRRLREGFKPVGWGGGYCYAIPQKAKNKEAAWLLLKWLSSLEANKIMVNSQASLMRAQGQIFLPTSILSPNLDVIDWVRQVHVVDNPHIHRRFVAAFDQFIAMMPTSKHRPVTPVGAKLWKDHVRATEAAVNHSKSPYDALSYGARQVQAALDQVLHPPTGPLVNWRWVVAGYLAAVALLVIGFLLAQEIRLRRWGGSRWQWIEGYVCVSPWLVGFLLLGAGPILFSIIISFCHYNVLTPARFIGLGNYVQLLGRHFDPVVGRLVWNDPLFWKSLLNTGYMVISVPISIVLGLAMAILLDTKIRGLRVYRTIYYLPAIVPAVAGFILWFWIFDPGRGMINQMLSALGVTDPPFWLQDPAWSKPSLIIMGLWGVGASMIIWLAGLKDIPVSLYEAASIDGAGRVRRFFSVTLPLLSPYIFFNLIMGLIAVFQIFEASYVMTEGGPADSTLFYVYKLFNESFRYLNMGVACAMAWLLFSIIIVITLFQLWLSKKWVYYGGE